MGNQESVEAMEEKALVGGIALTVLFIMSLIVIALVFLS